MNENPRTLFDVCFDIHIFGRTFDHVSIRFIAFSCIKLYDYESKHFFIDLIHNILLRITPTTLLLKEKYIHYWFILSGNARNTFCAMAIIFALIDLTQMGKSFGHINIKYTGIPVATNIRVYKSR